MSRDEFLAGLHVRGCPLRETPAGGSCTCGITTRLYEGRHAIGCALRQGVGTHCTCGVDASRVDPVLARLDAIFAELQSWTPIIAAMNWHLLGVRIDGDPPATITIGRNEPVDGTPVDPRAGDPRD